MNYISEIIKQRENGVIITHILNYYIEMTNNNNANIPKIQQFFRRNINNIINTENIEIVSNRYEYISIKWIISNSLEDNMSYMSYYTNDGLIYNDNIIEKHTKILIKRIQDLIFRDYPEYGNNWKIGYIISKI